MRVEPKRLANAGIGAVEIAAEKLRDATDEFLKVARKARRKTEQAYERAERRGRTSAARRSRTTRPKARRTTQRRATVSTNSTTRRRRTSR